MTSQARRIQASVDRFTERIVGTIELRAYQGITSGMPVDTGFARGSVTPGLASRTVSALNAPRSKDVARAEGSLMLQVNESLAKAIALSYRLSQGPVSITVAASYGRQLNNGSSAQAPRNFIQRAIVRAITSLRRGLV